MRKRDSSLLGCLITVLIPFAVIGWVVENIGGWMTVVLLFAGIIIIFGCLMVFSPPADCEICDTELKRKSYTRVINGKKYVICPACNRSIDNKSQRQKIKGFMERENL